MKKLTKNVGIIVFGLLVFLAPLFTVAFASTEVSTTKWGTVKHFDGEILDIELKDGKQIKATFYDIEMDPSRRAFGLFRGILTNAVVEINVDHIDENGLYFVSLNVDGADFDRIAVEQQWATKK